MVLPGHIAGGYIGARLVLFLTHATFSPLETTVLLVIGTLFGDGPDIDLLAMFWARISKKHGDKPSDHRLYITHAPISWLILSLIIVGIGYLFSSPFVQVAGWMVLAGSWSHLLFDSIEYGIRWLWPFSDKRFRMRQEPPTVPIAEGDSFVKYNIDFIIKNYPRWLTFYAEIAVTLVALWLAFH